IYDAYVADVLVRICLFGTICLCEVIRIGVARKGDRLPVRRPQWLGNSLRKVGELKRIAPRHCQHEELWMIRAVVLFGHANERKLFSIGRPTRTRIAVAASQSMRFTTCRGNAPYRDVVPILLFTNSHANKSDS